MSRRITLNEIIPNLLYQRGHFLTYPPEEKWRMLRENKIQVVVNLWTRQDPDLFVNPGELIYLHWSIPGNNRPPEEILQPIRSALLHFLSLGMKTLIHCESGVNRSVWLSAHLLSCVSGISEREALEKIALAGKQRINVRRGMLL